MCHTTGELALQGLAEIALIGYSVLDRYICAVGGSSYQQRPQLVTLPERHSLPLHKTTNSHLLDKDGTHVITGAHIHGAIVCPIA